jgi:hypothetical protein
VTRSSGSIFFGTCTGVTRSPTSGRSGRSGRTTARTPGCRPRGTVELGGQGGDGRIVALVLEDDVHHHRLRLVGADRPQDARMKAVRGGHGSSKAVRSASRSSTTDVCARPSLAHGPSCAFGSSPPWRRPGVLRVDLGEAREAERIHAQQHHAAGEEEEVGDHRPADGASAVRIQHRSRRSVGGRRHGVSRRGWIPSPA